MNPSLSCRLASRRSRFQALAWRLAAALALVLSPATSRAETHGGIEIGAKGVKITVVRATSRPEGLHMQVELATTANTTLVADLARTGAFAPEALEQTAKEVTKAYSRIRDEFKVAPERIYIVGSSGLFSAIRDKPDLIDANKKRLVDAVRKTTDRAMDFLSDEREAELSIDGIIPRAAAETGIVIDIGSGNTKGGFKDNKTGKYVSFSVPLGTVTFTDLVKKKVPEGKATFGKAAAEQRDGSLRPLLAWELVGKPALRERTRVYLSGGSVWAITTLAHPGDRRPFVALTRADVQAVLDKLNAHPDVLPLPDLSTITDAKDRAQTEADLKRITESFTPENLIAGAEILRGLQEEFGLEKPGKKCVFARHGYLGWLLAYIAEKETK